MPIQAQYDAWEMHAEQIWIGATAMPETADEARPDCHCQHCDEAREHQSAASGNGK